MSPQENNEIAQVQKDVISDLSGSHSKHGESTKDVEKTRIGAFSNLTREIKASDLKNPAVGRLLLDRIDILQGENLELSAFRENFYESDKKVAVLEKSSAGESKFQILYSACLTFGGIVIGSASSANGDTKNILYIGGFLLLIIGALLSVFVNKK